MLASGGEWPTPFGHSWLLRSNPAKYVRDANRSMITDLAKKVKAFLVSNRKDLFVAAVVFLVGIASFGLGRLSVLWPTKEPIRIIERGGERDRAPQPQPRIDEAAHANAVIERSAPPLSSPQGKFVASRRGTSYHLPSCPGAKQIKPENQIWFVTKEEAERSGYRPAGNCPGL